MLELMCLVCSVPYGKRLDDPTITSASFGTSSAGLSRPNSVLAQRYFFYYSLLFLHKHFITKLIYMCFYIVRLPQEQTETKDQPAATTTNSGSMTTGEPEAKQRRKLVTHVL